MRPLTVMAATNASAMYRWFGDQQMRKATTQRIAMLIGETACGSA